MAQFSRTRRDLYHGGLIGLVDLDKPRKHTNTDAPCAAVIKLSF
jgi:hypothetical protein